MFEREGEPKQYLARHIVVATVIDTPRRVQMPLPVQIVVDLRDGETPLLATSNHHQSYMQNDEEGAI
jgi:hypothetical protein